MDHCYRRIGVKNLPSFTFHRSAVSLLERRSFHRLVAGFRPPRRSPSLALRGRNARYASGARAPVASARGSEREAGGVAAPLEMRSPAGMFLSGVLRNQPHIFGAVAAEQLQQLSEDRDGALARKMNNVGTDEWCLHSRIAELREKECKTAVEEVMYMLVVHKFMEINVPLVPKLIRCIRNGKLCTWPSKDRELESVHGCEILEMIEEHFCRVLGQRGKSTVTDNWTAARVCRLHLGRVYAASVLYGYFLKSASQRHCLELNLIHLDVGLPVTCSVRLPSPGSWSETLDDVSLATSVSERLGSHCTCASPQYQYTGSVYRDTLKKYIMSFDIESFQRCASLRSKEAVNLVEKHCWALFGRSDENGANVLEDERLTVTFSSLKRLLLEAIAIGSFLWDIENYVGTVYRLGEN
ncbi:UV-B-induced protein At3g17800, chloroplastic [Nymphaea colorata]|nr:UV-B-induced protein At3g17800, chloroplastic [Nymphaea colorata]